MFESYIGQQISIFNMNSTVLFAEGVGLSFICVYQLVARDFE